MQTSWLVGAVVTLVAASAVALVPITTEVHSVPASRSAASVQVAPAPERPMSLLFIHHSVGFQLLSEPGTNPAAQQHENGGGLRRLLEESNYEVHSATYGSRLGEHTDLFDWPAKFTEHMTAVLATADGSKPLPGGKHHDVVLFKSCFPNNAFTGRGTAPGNPRGPDLTVENARAALNALLPAFERHPDTLFVYLTAPPLVGGYREPVWKRAVKTALGRGPNQRAEQAELAREFNRWVSAADGWLRDYRPRNVAVIDYYDILTDHGASNFLRYPTGSGFDPHPSSAGQQRAAREILLHLNVAVQRWAGKVVTQP